MPPDLAVHATAVAIGPRALVVLGASRSGKSRLAAALVARSSPALPILLVGDDRVLLSRRGGALIARPHHRIAGFIERRGLGLVAVPWRERARVAGLALLGDAAAPDWGGNLPVLRPVGAGEADVDALLTWWKLRTTAKFGIGKENALVYTRLPERAAAT